MTAINWDGEAGSRKKNTLLSSLHNYLSYKSLYFPHLYYGQFVGLQFSFCLFPFEYSDSATTYNFQLKERKEKENERVVKMTYSLFIVRFLNRYVTLQWILMQLTLLVVLCKNVCFGLINLQFESFAHRCSKDLKWMQNSYFVGL